MGSRSRWSHAVWQSRDYFDDLSSSKIDQVFGVGFSKKLATLELGSWQGPIRSEFGLHLVRIDSKKDPFLPTVNDIRQALLRDYQAEKRKVFLEKMYDDLSDAYPVKLEEELESFASKK